MKKCWVYILSLVIAISLTVASIGWSKYYNLREELWRQTAVSFDHSLLYSSKSLLELNKRLENKQSFDHEAAIAASWLRRLQLSSNFYFGMLKKTKDVRCFPEQISLDISTSDVKIIEDIIGKGQPTPPETKDKIKELARIYRTMRETMTTSVILNGDFQKANDIYNRKVHSKP